MYCRHNNKCGKLCPHFVVTTDVTFAAGALTLTLPDDITYNNCEKYCIVVGQSIPDTATINAPVVAVVGAGTTTFPLVTRCGAPVVVQQISTRRRYPVLVITSAAGGTIKMLCDLPEVEVTTLAALNDAGGA